MWLISAAGFLKSQNITAHHFLLNALRFFRKLRNGVVGDNYPQISQFPAYLVSGNSDSLCPKLSFQGHMCSKQSRDMQVTSGSGARASWRSALGGRDIVSWSKRQRDIYCHYKWFTPSQIWVPGQVLWHQGFSCHLDSHIQHQTASCSQILHIFVLRHLGKQQMAAQGFASLTAMWKTWIGF